MVRKLLATLLALTFVGPLGCYNTYSVSLEELAKVQEGGANSAVEVATADGEKVVVSANTRIGVTDSANVYHEISPFNFTLTRRQLVSPDEDLLLNRSDITTGNLKLVNGTKTLLLVLSGVALVVGGGAFIILNAPEKKQFGEE